MKKLSVFILSIFIFLCSFLNIKSEDYHPEDYKFIFTNYDVNIDVDSKGVYTVTETIDVEFNDLLHGIYLNIPTKYTNFKWTVDGEEITKDYTFPISDINVLSNHAYKVRNDSGGMTVRIGDPEYFANKNERYVVTYKVHTRDLDLNGIQSFYYNIITPYWNTYIYNSTFTINMPKDFDSSKLSFTTDGYDLDPNLKYEIINNTIKGELNTTITYGRGITIKLDLPNNYFDFSKDLTIIYILIIFSIIITLLLIYLLNKYGKDEKIIPTVEFKAPDNLNSAECSYILNNKSDNKGIASLFISWANLGCINIIESKNKLTFSKIKNLPSTCKSYEQNLFNSIFKESDNIDSTYISKNFYYEYNSCKSSLQNYFSTVEPLFIKKSENIMIISIILFLIPLSICVYYYSYIHTYSYILPIIFTLLSAGILLPSFIYINRYVENKLTLSIFRKFFIFILSFIFIFLSLQAVLIISNIVEIKKELMLSIWLITIINLLISTFMKKRSEFGVNSYSKVIGLKDFILHAEKDRIDMLFNENPNIFFDILPYAYAFGLTRAWEKHFKHLEIVKPYWYKSTTYTTNSYKRIVSDINRVSNTIPPTISRSNGGGNFYSGGNSSGGGFTGGGFGGSSGGGW